MKKILLLSGFCLAFASFSCNQSGTKNKDMSTATTDKSPDSLQILAKTFFKALPAIAENNEMCCFMIPVYQRVVI